MEWQPIETAPQDGTRVLVCYETARALRVTEGRFSTDAPDGEWKVDIGFVPATHWMPLPTPPPRPEELPIAICKKAQSVKEHPGDTWTFTQDDANDAIHLSEAVLGALCELKQGDPGYVSRALAIIHMALSRVRRF